MMDDDEGQEAVAIKRRDEMLKRIQRRDDFKEVMGSRAGRSTIWWVLEECNAFSSIFNEHSGAMYAMSGKRDIGLMIFARVHELCPDLYQIMVQENQPNNGDQE